MRGNILACLAAGAALGVATLLAAAPPDADTATYRLPRSGAGRRCRRGCTSERCRHFPTPAERAAAAAAGPRPPVYTDFAKEFAAEQRQPGVSGLAIDLQDQIPHVFNRGAKPVMIFDREGNLLRAGADQVINGKKLDPNAVHSGTVDWQGNIYVIEREHHRIVKLDPTLRQIPDADRCDR